MKSLTLNCISTLRLIGQATLEPERRLNLDSKLYTTICKAAGSIPPDQAGPDDDFRAATGEARPSEVKVFDYIYGVLHSPAYRETFAEFLKIDFPRIPYPPPRKSSAKSAKRASTSAACT